MIQLIRLKIDKFNIKFKFIVFIENSLLLFFIFLNAMKNTKWF